MKEIITTFTQTNTYKLEVTEVDNWYMYYKKSYKYNDEGEVVESVANADADEAFAEYESGTISKKPTEEEQLKKWEKAYEYYKKKLDSFSKKNRGYDTSKSSLNSVEFKTELEQKYTSNYAYDNSIQYEFEETTTEIKIKMNQEEPNEELDNWEDIKDTIYVDENCFLQVYDEFTEGRYKLTTDYQAFFEMLEQNSKTIVLVDLIKYMMYLYDGTDYGVTTLNLQLFEPESFSTINGLVGNTIEAKIYYALANYGYTIEQVAGLLGNLYAESGLSCTATNRNSGAYGLAQWLGGRLTGLQTYASFQGKDISDENIQIEYLIAEISGQGNAAEIASRRTYGRICMV